MKNMVKCKNCKIKLNDFFAKFKFCPWCHRRDALVPWTEEDDKLPLSDAAKSKKVTLDDLFGSRQV